MTGLAFLRIVRRFLAGALATTDELLKEERNAERTQLMLRRMRFHSEEVEAWERARGDGAVEFISGLPETFGDLPAGDRRRLLRDGEVPVRREGDDDRGREPSRMQADRDGGSPVDEAGRNAKEVSGHVRGSNGEVGTSSVATGIVGVAGAACSGDVPNAAIRDPKSSEVVCGKGRAP
jgi:hypothetical protein